MCCVKLWCIRFEVMRWVGFGVTMMLNFVLVGFLGLIDCGIRFIYGFGGACGWLL